MIVISIPKPAKDYKISENYRLITLLSSLSKIYKRVILFHQQKNLNTKVTSEQFAFRFKHFPTLQLTRLTHLFSKTSTKT